MYLFKAWDKHVTTESTNEVLTELAWKHLREVEETDRRARQYEDIVAMVSSRNFAGLCTYEFGDVGLSPSGYWHLSQVLAFFKKRQDLDIGVDRRKVALLKFEESELACASTNSLFRRWQAGDFQFPPSVERVLHAAQRKIALVLGDCPELEQFKVRFGPGGTTQVKKREACAKAKLSQSPACSEDLLPLVKQLLEGIPGYTFDRVDTESAVVEIQVHHGKLEFVPKNAKTDRPIVVEPWLNSFLQLGIGDYMADRLRRFGVDISDQERNQNLARLGSISGALATLDLSSASDSVSTGLVEHLLSPEWFDLLCFARSGTVVYNGRVRRLEKISSMGNGYTFPLETLIFWAITTAICGNDPLEVSVYGDDIICPAHKAEEVMSTLNILGFKVNREKSFWDGPFRESCGRDYLSGIDVRPLFIERPLKGHDVFRLHNYYVRRGWSDFAALLLSKIDPQIALTGPDGYGDGHLVVDSWKSKTPKWVTQGGFGGVTFDTWCYRKRDIKTRLPGDRVLPVYSIYVREDTEKVVDSCLQRERRFRLWLINQDPDNIPVQAVGQGMRFLRDGTPVNYLPGAGGCKRISIYTFERPYREIL